MAEPLVSVITPTWGRHDLLLDRCIPSVQAQTWPNVEHVIVSDGPDPALRARMNGHARFDELPEHLHAQWGHYARLRGIELAEGDVIAYLDDDNAYRPGHLEAVVTALLAEGADFAYSIALMQGHGMPYPVGQDPPAYGQIDTSLIVHRRELLEVATWQWFDGIPTIDWDIVDRWMQAGARWAFVPYVTVDYYFS